jgi:hypothetical protein
MARKKPVISPFGQWAYPGEVTIIPSSDITMKGVNYPVLGIDNLGNQQMMMPGGEYTFPGDYVTEYPQMNKGGQMIKRKDGSYSKRGLWDNIRANKGSGKKPTKEMLEQERKIKAKMQNGGWLEQYQSGGLLSMGDYDLTTAPKRGDYLLPDINRPSYIDDAGNKRSEYRMGFNIHGKETLIPSVVNGRQLSEDEALDRYYKTGLHMGQFNTPEEADYASRLRTARYNMLEDPIRFQADQFQRGGMLPPIYTSNPRDPRIRNYQDSLNLYKEQNRLNILNDKTNYPQQSARPTINKNNLIYTGDPNKGGYVNPKIFSSNIPTLSKDIHGNLKQQYKKPVQPVIYKKPEVSPIYTSDLNDPRLRSYNDSLSLYNEYLKPAEINKTLKEIKNDSRFRYYRPSTRTELNSFPGKIKPILGTEFDFSRIDADLISGRSTKHNYYPTYDSSGRIMPGEIGTHLSFKKPVQPYIYRKPEVIPEVIETPVVPVPVVEPPKPRLAISNIDRDMYTPGGGMGREYNIGVTLQDGNRKSFRTEKEFQDWKAANNLDISKAKVTEGRGYSYDYPENKKYGGWLDQYQDGSEVPSDIERMDAAVIKRDRSWLDKLKGYIHRGEKAIGLDPYNERPDDFMEQWARRINTATGGRDWYKQPNDASGAGGIGTAMMETVMAPFSAPQLASVYGATGKVQMPSEAMNIQNPVGSFLADAVLDPTNLVGAGIAKNLGKGSLQNMVRPRMRGVRPSIQNSVDNIATPNISQSASISPVAWQAQELPGLHLKSTMTDGPISKIVEPKTGLVNVEQALGIIGKESGGIDKVALIKQGLGENIPKKMDYNDFRKTVQDQLIPLEKQFSTERSDYGINRLGYTPGKFVTKEVGGKKIHTYESDYLDNQTILFSNKDKFGRGSGAHGNPDETLGHAHYLIDKESPDVLTVTQIQSDAFQGTHRSMPKNIDDAVSKLNKTQANSDDVLELMGDEKEKFKSVFDIADKELQLDKATIENFTQKSLLDKNHQERYLQELVDYAGKQDYLNKVRVPTPRTAAKVQNYRPISQAMVGDVDLELAALNNNSITSIDDLSTQTLRTITQDFDIRLSKINNSGLPEQRDLKDIISELDTKGAFKKLSNKNDFISLFDTDHQTILKKYAEQPKTIKKLFGEEPKIVTDSKGNTWYEFDIPKKFKEGKGEIKAFSTIGGIGVAGAAASQLQEQRYGGWLNKYQVGGENLPELNSKIDIANFYKNPLSEKYSIYQDPEDNTYKYYKKSKETIPSKQNYISYTDQNKLMEDTLSEFPIIPPVWSEVLSSIPQEEKVNTITKPKTLPNKQSISKKTSTPQNQFSFDPNYWNDVNLQNEVFNRQLKDNKWYGSFDERGDNVLNRTDVKRNYDSEVFLQNMATPNSVIIDIGSALGNNNPKLAGVSVYELTSNPKIKSKNIKVIATDIPSEVKGFEELKKRNTVYPIDYTAVPETFNTPIRDILKNKKIESVKDVYLRAANSIDLLMNVQETAEHFKHISSTLKDKNVTYLYNNTILYKPAGSTKFKKLGNLNNSAFDHRSATWKNNTNRNHYTLLPTNENGGEIGWLNKYK